jgi:hypothetical protein
VVKNVKSVGDRMSYMLVILRSRRYDSSALNVHAPTEDNTDEEEFERVFDKFLKYHMEIVWG